MFIKMKKLLILVVCILTYQITMAQFPVKNNIGGRTTENRIPGLLSADSVMRVPRKDTTSSRLIGAITYNSNTEKLYLKTNSTWREISSTTLYVGNGITINGDTLVLDSTSVLIPRYTKADRDALASPEIGYMIYQLDEIPGLRVYNGTAWIRFTEIED